VSEFDPAGLWHWRQSERDVNERRRGWWNIDNENRRRVDPPVPEVVEGLSKRTDRNLVHQAYGTGDLDIYKS
jgi:hypothetical protein